ncbi:hypothetical protein CDV31_006662, partial [Fusarium ambrosium]
MHCSTPGLSATATMEESFLVTTCPSFNSDLLASSPYLFSSSFLEMAPNLIFQPRSTPSIQNGEALSRVDIISELERSSFIRQSRSWASLNVTLAPENCLRHFSVAWPFDFLSRSILCRAKPQRK